MNYLERLIRRALLTTQSSETLRDPFENQAPLELQTPPARVAAPKQSRAPDVVAPAAEVRVEHHELRTETEIHAVERRIEAAAPAAPIEPARIPEVRTPATPIERADQFMRALGLPALPAERAKSAPQPVVAPAAPLPTPGTSAEPLVAVDATAPITPAPAELPPRRVAPPNIVPPPAPLREPMPARAEPATPGKEPVSSMAKARRAAERPASRPPAREVVRERVHIVKVVEGGSSPASSHAGAAPSTFGAAQL